MESKNTYTKRDILTLREGTINQKLVNMHTITAEQVTKTFVQAGEINHVLRDVSYTFDSSKTYAITGASGAGKSTLLHVLAGIDTPTSGVVRYDDLIINTLTGKRKAHFLHHTLGLVFQDPHLVKELTVAENVMLKALIAQQPYDESYKKARELLELVGLADKADHHPLSLSGGQQQRVAVLRALFNRPPFLLADEPTGNLDAENAQKVVDILLRGHEWGMGILICSHDPAVASRMKELIVLEQGMLIKRTHKK